jgi:hypothetical protein
MEGNGIMEKEKDCSSVVGVIVRDKEGRRGAREHDHLKISQQIRVTESRETSLAGPMTRKQKMRKKKRPESGFSIESMMKDDVLGYFCIVSMESGTRASMLL